MAKKHLEQYDKNGNRLDIYLNKDEVMVDNKALGVKLNEMDAAIAMSGGGGGYSLLHVITNINTLQEKIDEVIGKLANSAFTESPKPETIGDFSWQSDEPVDTYYTVSGIDSLSTMYSVTNDASLVLGGTTYTNTITAKTGYDLVSVSVNGTAQTISNDQCTISISNVRSNISIVVTATVEVPTYSISYSLTHCHKTAASPTSVAQGGMFTATIAPDDGYTLEDQTATGDGFTQSYDSDNGNIVISGSSVQGNIAITCAATTFDVSVDYDLTGFSSESDTTIQSGGSFTKVLSPNSGYKVTSITITMGGVDITSTAWNSNTKTITIPLVTGDIDIVATAEATTDHFVYYNLQGVTKTSGPDEIADDNESDVSIVLAKGSDWSDYANPNVDFEARDILVMVDGEYLERGTSLSNGDFSATKANGVVTITIPASAITGDVVIMNIPWKEKYVMSKALPAATSTNSPAQSAGEVRITTTNTSVYTNLFMPIPESCDSMELYSYKNTDGLAAYAVGCAFYDDANPTDDSTNDRSPWVVYSCVRGVGIPGSARVVDLTSQTIPGTASNWDYARSGATRDDYVSFRTSCYVTSNTSENISSALNHSYIYDVSNDKFIWYGTSVDRESVRSNHE